MNNKKQKKVGIVRTGAVIPFLVFVVIVTLFNYFLLDTSIKKSVIYFAEKLNRAEVNIASVNTSIKDLSLSIKNIEVTDFDSPEFNKIVIGNIDLNLLWDALLRAKFVVEIANIQDIKVNVKRSSPGELYPLEVDESGEAKVKIKTQKVFKRLGKSYDNNIFGDISSVLGGGSTGDVKKDVVSNLESKKKLEAVSEKINIKKSEINKQITSLPSSDEIKKLEKRIKSIRWKDLGNISKAPKVLKEADSANRDLQSKLKKYKELNKNINSTIKELRSDYKEAQSLVKKDVSNVKSRMNIPSLDKKVIAQSLFGDDVLDYFVKAESYHSVAKEYMPPKKDKKKAVSTPRLKGRDYQFGTPNSYPSFWLKLGKINSSNEQGNVEGVIKNLTNNQTAINRLTDIIIKADFPKKNIRGFNSTISIDHRYKPIVKFNGSVDEFVVNDKQLSKDKDLTFGINESVASMSFSGTLLSSDMDMKLKNIFRVKSYDVKAKNKYMKTLLNDVALKTKKLTLNASLRGDLKDLKIDINSNLADAIQRSVGDIINDKIKETERKIREDINSQIKTVRDKVDGQLKSLTSQVNSKLDGPRKNVEKIQNDLKSTKKKAEKDAKNSLKKSLKGLIKF